MLTTLSSFVACSPGSSEKSEGGSGARKGEKEKKEQKRYKKIERQRGWICGILDRLWEKTRKNKAGKGKRMWCKHLLITLCRIDTDSSYSATESEAVGTGLCECTACDHWHVGGSDMQDPAWHDLGVTHDLWQHQDVSQFLSTKRKLGHQKQHGAHSSTTLTFTNPLSIHARKN